MQAYEMNLFGRRRSGWVAAPLGFLAGVIAERNINRLLDRVETELERLPGVMPAPVWRGMAAIVAASLIVGTIVAVAAAARKRRRREMGALDLRSVLRGAALVIVWAVCVLALAWKR
jgi:hypothetical protein